MPVGLKKAARVVEKAALRHDVPGDASRVLDIVRAMVVVPSMEAVAVALASIVGLRRTLRPPRRPASAFARDRKAATLLAKARWRPD